MWKAHRRQATRFVTNHARLFSKNLAGRITKDHLTTGSTKNCRETKSHKQTTRGAGDMTSPTEIKVTRNNARELLRIDVREAFYTLAERLSRPCLSEMQSPAPRPSKTNICRTARARKRASSGGEGALLSHLPSFSVNAYLAHAEMFI